MKDFTNGNLDKELEFAKTIPTDSLTNMLQRLDVMKNNQPNSEVTIMNDYAPHSFYFECTNLITGNLRLNGGIIFHGPHDNGGNGSAPTFSVSMTPDSNPHWEMHT